MEVGTSTSRSLSPQFVYTRMFLVFISAWHAMFKVSINAINCLLKFFKLFIWSMGNSFQLQHLCDVASAIPSSLKAVHKSLDVKDDFICYVVCPMCHSIYEYEDCVIHRSNGLKESKRCCHVQYPNHPRVSLRTKTCDTVLLKKIKSKSGYHLQAKKTYPYMPLNKSLGRLVARRDMLDICEKWRSRQESIPNSFMGDIYDGDVWKVFSSSEYQNFLNSPNCFLLALNVDWFEPFERGVYAVGAIYLTVLNLPRNIRYKPENIFLVGIIPGPKEPQLTINSYLTPLVIDLKNGWSSGFHLPTYYGNNVTVKVALACIT